MLRVYGDSEKLDAFIALLRPYGLRELVRSGKILMVARPPGDLSRRPSGAFATRCQSPTPGYDIVWHFESGPEPVITVLAASSAAGAFVPEPSLATLAALALCGALAARRRPTSG